MNKSIERQRNLSQEAAAAKLGVSYRTISRAIQAGCPHDRIGKAIRVDIVEVRAFFRERDRARKEPG